MRVALADDSALFRQGMRLMLTAASMEVTVEARTGAELLARVRDDPPDAAILDIRMPPTFTDEGLRTAHDLREQLPSVGVLVLSTYAETSYAVRLLGDGEGGVGYLLKDRVDDVATLCDALGRVTRGEAVVDPDIVRRLFTRRRSRGVLDELTHRERLVLKLLAEGPSDAGIAGRRPRGAHLRAGPESYRGRYRALGPLLRRS